jgi:hypothetical protein
MFRLNNSLALLTILALLVSSLNAYAAQDQTTVTLEVPEVRAIWLKQGTNFSSADLTNVTLTPTATDLNNGETPLTQIGFIHYKANTDHQIVVERDTGNYPTGVELWFRPDSLAGWPQKLDPNTEYGPFVANAVGNSGVMDLRWQFKGIDWTTPVGTYSSTVTFTIENYL